MFRIVWLLLISLSFGCSNPNNHPLIGSWKECHKWTGEYIEHRYFDNHVLYTSEGYWAPAIFPVEIVDDTFMVRSLGRLLRFKIDPLSNDSLLLHNEEDSIFLIRLEEDIPLVDSLHLDEWLETYEIEFKRRAKQWTECVRLPSLNTLIWVKLTMILRILLFYRIP